MASGRRLLVSTLVLFGCDVIGGLLAVVSDVATWREAWGFDSAYTVPLPIGAVQLGLAWLASRDARPRVARVATITLGTFCLISLLFGLFDGDLTNKVTASGYPGGITWGLVLVAVTAVVGVLAVARARELRRR
jgi:hypothetical protein